MCLRSIELTNYIRSLIRELHLGAVIKEIETKGSKYKSTHYKQDNGIKPTRISTFVDWATTNWICFNCRFPCQNPQLQDLHLPTSISESSMMSASGLSLATEFTSSNTPFLDS